MWTPMTTLTTGQHSTSTIAWRFTSCTSTNSSTECTCFVHFIHIHIGSSSSLVRTFTPSSWPSMWLLSLHLDFLLVPLHFPPVCCPFHLLPPQRRAEAGAQQEDCGKPAPLRGKRGWGHLRRPLPPQVMSPTVMTSTSSSVPLSSKIPNADQDVDDLTFGKILSEAYRGQDDYFVWEGVSIHSSTAEKNDN